MGTSDDSDTSLSRKPTIYADEIEFLQGLFLNSDKFIFRGPGAKITATSQTDVEEPETLRVAMIAFRMPNPEQHVKLGELPERFRLREHGQYRFVRFPDGSNELSSDEIVQIVRTCLQQFREAGAPVHFLLLNELAVSYQNSTSLLSELKRELETNGMSTTIGILGSHHCDQTFLNVSTIMSPFMEASSCEVVGQSLKQNSARKQNELIRTPDGTSFVRYETPYGDMIVWICLDLYDPNLVLKLLRTNYRLSPPPHSGQVIDMLFVPSYNADKKQSVRNMALMISKFCRMAVFVCNDSENIAGRVGWNENMCFYMGEEVTGFQHDEISPKKCNVSVFEIGKWRDRRERV